jgi:hypothetical protein
MMLPSIQSSRALGFVASLSVGLVVSSTALLAASGDTIGSAVAIINTVTVEYADEKRELAAGDNVRQDEFVEVSADSQGEFRLDDNTKLALGPGARLLLDRFVYDSDRKTGSIVVNLVKGAFRFMTGVAAKSTYVVRTPTAAITVRGTVFDVFILADNSTLLLLHEGAIEVRGDSDACQVLDRPGYLLRVSETGRVGTPINWQRLPGRTVTFDAAFPFVGRPPQIDPMPVLSRSAIVDAAYARYRTSACITAAPVMPGLRRIDLPPPRPKDRVRRIKADPEVDVIRVRPGRVVKKPPPKRPTSPPERSTDAGGPPIGISIGIGGFRPGGRGIGPRHQPPKTGGGRSKH